MDEKQGPPSPIVMVAKKRRDDKKAGKVPGSKEKNHSLMAAQAAKRGKKGKGCY